MTHKDVTDSEQDEACPNLLKQLTEQVQGMKSQLAWPRNVGTNQNNCNEERPQIVRSAKDPTRTKEVRQQADTDRLHWPTIRISSQVPDL